MDKTLLKGLSMLETLVSSPGQSRSVEDVAALTGLTRSNAHRTLQTLIGAGFISSIAGGYFNLMGQRHLLTAVDLFNQQYHKKQTVSLGVGNQSLGLVVKW